MIIAILVVVVIIMIVIIMITIMIYSQFTVIIQMIIH